MAWLDVKGRDIGGGAIGAPFQSNPTFGAVSFLDGPFQVGGAGNAAGLSQPRGSPVRRAAGRLELGALAVAADHRRAGGGRVLLPAAALMLIADNRLTPELERDLESLVADDAPLAWWRRQVELGALGIIAVHVEGERVASVLW